MRALVQNLRVGASWRSVIASLARAVTYQRRQLAGPLPVKSVLDVAAAVATDAFHVCPSLDVLVPALLAGGAEGLASRISLTPGVQLSKHLCLVPLACCCLLQSL